MHPAPVIVWLRNDLRLEDHPSFHAASLLKKPVLAVYIFDTEKDDRWAPKENSLWWLNVSLKELQSKLQDDDIQLVVRKGAPLKVLKTLISETGADTVFYTRRYEPFHLKKDAAIKKELQDQGITVESFKGQLLFEPWEVLNNQKKPFQVFSPFYKKCLSLPPPRSPFKKGRLIPFLRKIKTESIKIPKSSLKNHWRPGSDGAKIALNRFIKNSIKKYPVNRDFPAILGVSYLSPHLHFGEITPYQIAKAASKYKTYLRQIIWREFTHHLLFHFPEMPEKALKKKFNKLPWNKNPKLLKCWKEGKTGYPIVDAGMRELVQTGWMHNRVRMIVGSFLAKDLLLPWQEGEKWFWEKLVDADLANNSFGWQWVAGTGADAAPYFRIFNPISQGQKYDPKGEYVRRFIPELKKLPNDWIHEPWRAPTEILKKAGIKLGTTYPYPIIDHDEARKKALRAYKQSSEE